VHVAALIVGLGNPGSTYAATRHNVGFMVVDEICRRVQSRFVPGRGEYERASKEGDDGIIHLVKPTTYMNGSGTAVAEALEHTGLTPDSLLIVLDDFQIPLGTLRLRPKGSDGGHHGLASVLWTLGIDLVPRLRLGIGSEELPPAEFRRDFVLDPFAPEELIRAQAMIARAADAAMLFASAGIDRAMRIANTQ
jgi:peptidyl-tRNA hydrolase, PTH1 family